MIRHSSIFKIYAGFCVIVYGAGPHQIGYGKTSVPEQWQQMTAIDPPFSGYGQFQEIVSVRVGLFVTCTIIRIGLDRRNSRRRQQGCGRRSVAAHLLSHPDAGRIIGQVKSEGKAPAVREWFVSEHTGPERDAGFDGGYVLFAGSGSGIGNSVGGGVPAVEAADSIIQCDIADLDLVQGGDACSAGKGSFPGPVGAL
jgi:hypothetical protein